MRTLIKDLKEKLDQEVTICGWVDIRRDHGKLVFADLRDRSGKAQLIISPKEVQAYEEAKEIRPEWVIQVTGLVGKRPDANINPDLLNGNLEIQVKEIKVLNKAQTPPFEVSSDGYEVGEEHRLGYRYIDLRRERLQENILFRHQVIKLVRSFLSDRNFIEIETPILTKSTPEGARDYVVPSRTNPGKFYALPQSPQQYKQLLMVAGFEKYFQIARCFRDEDTRGDRQPEFTQVDMELSFVDQEEVMKLNEELLIEIVKKLAPGKKIMGTPFPRFTYKDIMEKYGTDRPDLRRDKNDPNELAFAWIIDFPFFEKEDDGGWTFTHNPFSLPKAEHVELLKKGEKVEEILTTQYDIVLNGFEIGGGSTRAHNPEIVSKVLEIMGYNKEQIETNFGHILNALSYGAPPHGGIAWGFDRLMAILRNEPNIREVIAFPKTGEGKDPMMDSPSQITRDQLKELYLKVLDKKG